MKIIEKMAEIQRRQQLMIDSGELRLTELRDRAARERMGVLSQQSRNNALAQACGAYGMAQAAISANAFAAISENPKKKFYKKERFNSKWKRNKKDPAGEIDINFDNLLCGRG